MRIFVFNLGRNNYLLYIGYRQKQITTYYFLQQTTLLYICICVTMNSRLKGVSKQKRFYYLNVDI